MLMIGTHGQKQTLYGWVDTEEDLQRVSDALDAKIERMQGIENDDAFPARTYVPWGATTGQYFTWKGSPVVRGGCVVIGSWVDIVFEVDYNGDDAEVWAAKQRMLLR